MMNKWTENEKENCTVIEIYLEKSAFSFICFHCFLKIFLNYALLWRWARLMVKGL